MNWRTTIVTATMILTASLAAQAQQAKLSTAGKTGEQIMAEAGKGGKLNIESLLSNLTVLSKTKTTFAGKKLMLVFASTGSGPSEQFVSVAEELQRQNSDKLNTVYIYGQKSDKSVVQERARTSAMTLSFDESDNVIFESFRITDVPMVFLFDAGGRYLEGGVASPDGVLTRDHGQAPIKISGVLAQVLPVGKSADQIRAESVSADGRIDVRKLLSNVEFLSKKKPELSGKKTMIIFSATWCGPCHAFLPKAEELQKLNADHLNIIYIFGMRSEKPEVQKLADSSGMTITYDPQESEVSGAFEVNSIPTAMVIDKDGTLLKLGNISDNYVRDINGGQAGLLSELLK